jgi:hypothetical protein
MPVIDRLSGQGGVQKLLAGVVTRYQRSSRTVRGQSLTGTTGTHAGWLGRAKVVKRPSLRSRGWEAMLGSLDEIDVTLR